MKVKKMTRFIKMIISDRFIGITLAPFGIYLREDYISQERLINHENIHWRQQMEMLIILFYLWYLIEWLVRLPFGDAYKNLSF